VRAVATHCDLSRRHWSCMSSGADAERKGKTPMSPGRTSFVNSFSFMAHLPGRSRFLVRPQCLTRRSPLPSGGASGISYPAVYRGYPWQTAWGNQALHLRSVQRQRTGPPRPRQRSRPSALARGSMAALDDAPARLLRPWSDPGVGQKLRGGAVASMQEPAGRVAHR
jgi:hypothetical protein